MTAIDLFYDVISRILHFLIFGHIKPILLYSWSIYMNDLKCLPVFGFLKIVFIILTHICQLIFFVCV